MDPMSLLSLQYGGGGVPGLDNQAMRPLPGGGVPQGGAPAFDPRRAQAMGQMGLGMMAGRGIDPRLAMQAMAQQRRRRRPGDPGYDPAVDGAADPYAQQTPWWQGQQGGTTTIGGNRY
jgi:hypothetical protein